MSMYDVLYFCSLFVLFFFFFFQAEDGIRDYKVTGVQTCALPISLIVEFEAVLTRPEHLDASGLTSRQMNQVLDALVKVADPVHLWFLWRPRLKDPADEMVLET